MSHTREIVQRFDQIPSNTLWAFVQAVIACFRDGELNTEDFYPFLDSTLKAFDELTATFDIPRVPEWVENAVIWPVVRSLIPGGIRTLFSAFNIPLPAERPE